MKKYSWIGSCIFLGLFDCKSQKRNWCSLSKLKEFIIRLEERLINLSDRSGARAGTNTLSAGRALSLCLPTPFFFRSACFSLSEDLRRDSRVNLTPESQNASLQQKNQLQWISPNPKFPGKTSWLSFLDQGSFYGQLQTLWSYRREYPYPPPLERNGRSEQRKVNYKTGQMSQNVLSIGSMGRSKWKMIEY